MNSNNVISFPASSNSANLNQNADDLRLSLIEQKKILVDDLVDYHSTQLLSAFGMSGINVNNDDFIRDFGFIAECMKSCFYRSVGIFHPIQESVDLLVSIEDSESYEPYDEDSWDPDYE